MHLTLMKGDKVVITIPKENREWGYNPCPDGTVAEFIAYTEIDYGRLDNFGKPPGIYENTSWARLLMPDGKEHVEYTDRLEFLDPKVGETRESTFRREDVRVRDLPETPFWEGDFVIIHKAGHPHDNQRMQVVGIDYAYLDKRTSVDTPWPAYKVSDSLDAGWRGSVAAEDAELIERGPVWKIEHGKPVVFADLKEELNLARKMGRTRDARNDARGIFIWTKDEALAAIKDGRGHAMRVAGQDIDGAPGLRLERCDDPELGARAAAATLAGFKVK